MDDDVHATLQALADVFGNVLPHGAGDEQRFAVGPLTAVAVVDPWRRRDPETSDGRAIFGEPDFGVGDQVSGDGDGGLAGHGGPQCREGWRAPSCADGVAEGGGSGGGTGVLLSRVVRRREGV